VGGQETRHIGLWQGFALTQLDSKLQTTSLQLLPGYSLVVDLLADAPGNWTVRDAVPEILHAGPFASFRV
jgi:hypothetical protein